MAEWWTYRPSDFLMFSSHSYYRQFELYNADLWPLQPIAIALGVGLLGVLAWARARRPCALWPQRIGCLLLGMAWLWVGIGYHAQRFASINAAASGYAIAFLLQAGVLVALGLTLHSAGPRGPDRADEPRPQASVHLIGLALLAVAVLAYPLAGLPFSRPLAQAEVFGLAPDPTAVATLGLMLLLPRANTALQRSLRCSAWAIALGWCALSALTLATLGGSSAWLLPLSGWLALAPSAAAWRAAH